MSRRVKPLNGDPSRAVAYIRCSTDRQELSPEAQRAEIATYAARQSIEVVGWFDDLATSGTTALDARAGFMDALSALRSNGCGVFLVSRLDRLARSAEISAVAERILGDAGAVLTSADGAGNGDGPNAQLVRQILAAVNAHERAIIALRTKEALRAKRRRGEASNGSPPYGLRREGSKWVENEDEARAVAKIRRLHEGGRTVREIARVLNDHCDSFPPRGARWHETSVRRVLAAT